jgi:hypothetical protein
MGSSWQTETGHLRLNWDEAGCDAEEISRPVVEGVDGGGSHLEPVPDFAAHSPFGGATWFYPDPSAALNKEER